MKSEDQKMFKHVNFKGEACDFCEISDQDNSNKPAGE